MTRVSVAQPTAQTGAACWRGCVASSSPVLPAHTRSAPVPVWVRRVEGEGGA